MENQETPFKAGLNAGLILGIFSIVITFIVYFINPPTLVSGTYGFTMLAVYFGILIYMGIQYRKSLGGFMEFGPAFNFSFIALIISGLISQVGTALLYYVVDPALPGVLADQLFENQMAMMERFVSADAIPVDEIDKMRESAASGFTIMGQIKAFGIVVIVYAVVSLILGAILKRRDKSLDY